MTLRRRLIIEGTYGASVAVLWFTLIAMALARPTGGTTLSIEPLPYDFKTALRKGVVDISSDRWSGHDRALLIKELPSLDPGLVNRFAFFYGGPTDADLETTRRIAAAVHAVLPRALLGATLPEVIRDDYDVTLTCSDGQKARFTAGQLGGAPLNKGLRWVDLSRPAAVQFYERLGQCFIDMGFTFLHFEQAHGVLSRADDKVAALANYVALARGYRTYAAAKGVPVYLSGDHTLAADAHLEAVYEPSRFFHLSPEMRPFQNRVERPGHGVGYSYVLSAAVIAAQRAVIPHDTTALFYVDNWDSSQDDLRRLMELDADNRRYLIVQSLRTARENGAVFVPSLDHCVGCVPPSDLGDQCEILPDGRTQYDALACGDMPLLDAKLAY